MRFLARGLECLLGNIRTSRAWKRKTYETTWPRWSLSLKNAAQLNQVVTDMVEGIAAETVSDDDKNDFRRFQTSKMGTDRKKLQKNYRKFSSYILQIILKLCWRIGLFLYSGKNEIFPERTKWGAFWLEVQMDAWKMSPSMHRPTGDTMLRWGQIGVK